MYNIEIQINVSVRNGKIFGLPDASDMISMMKATERCSKKVIINLEGSTKVHTCHTATHAAIVHLLLEENKSIIMFM